MKKLFKIFSFLYAESNQDDIRINNLMTNIFFDKTTNQSIDLFERFKEKYEAELKERNLNALIENSDIEAYFKKSKEIEQWTQTTSK